MDMCLTGRMMDAEEAERAGLVSRIVTLDKLMETAKEAAAKIASQSQPIAMKPFYRTSECTAAWAKPAIDGTKVAPYTPPRFTPARASVAGFVH